VAACAVGALVAAPHLRVWRHLRAARQALERRDFEQAQDHLDRCLADRPDDGELHFLAGQTARRRGAFDLAEQHLHTCGQLGWAPERLALEWALLRAQQGDLDAVEVPLQNRVREGDAESSLILEALASGSLRVYRLRTARKYLEDWLARDPEDFQALLWYGEVMERLTHFPQAAEAYKKAVQRNPGHDDARLRLARVLVRNQPAEAAEQFEHLRQRGGPSVQADAVVGLARCRQSLGQPEMAQRLLDEFLAEKEPEHVEALTERGRMALDQGQEEEAGRLLGKAVRLAPHERTAVFQYSRCLQRLGRQDEARHWRRRLEQIEQDLRTLEGIHRQVHQSPRDPGLRCTAGLILLRNRQEREGVRWLESALRLDALHRPSHEALADYYQHAGDSARAAFHRRQAEAAPRGVPGQGSPR
jgi:tetratricopeptide (TPR) repeat protein